MDPNATLEALLEEARRVIAEIDAADNGSEERFVRENARVEMLCEYVIALDEWLSKGGFLPTAWSTPAFSNGVTIAQAIALGSKVIANDVMHVAPGGSMLPAEYLHVSYLHDRFELGIDREGRASS